MDYHNMVKMLILAGFLLLFFVGGLYFGMNDATKHPDYSFCELGDLVGDDVERIMYEGYTLDYHTKDFSHKQIIDFARRCIAENVSSQYEMSCCLTYRMYPKAFNE